MHAAGIMLQNKEGKSPDFVTSYHYHCEVYNVCPHRTVLSSVKGQVLDLQTDRLKIEDWPPFCKALVVNRSFKWISLTSNYFKNHPEFRGDLSKFQLLQSANKLTKLPAVLRLSVLDSLCQSLVKCLNQIEELVGLELGGLPLSEQQINDLCKAFQNAKCLRHISFSHCAIGKGGIEAICKALKNTLSVKSVSLSNCGISVQGAVCIASVLKLQSIKRYGEAWQESLRYRCPNLDKLSGLRRITLNNNPEIADDGAVALANALQEDMWLKALDLQNCGIAVKGAQSFLTTLNVNIALEILDLRGNSKIGGQLLQQILEKLKRNNEGKLCEYPWLPNENILSVSKSLPIRSRSSKPWARRAVEQKKRSLSADTIKRRNCLTKHSSIKLIKSKEELNELASSCLSMSSSSAEELKKELKELKQCLMKEEAARKATESQLLDALLENRKLRSQLEQKQQPKGQTLVDDLTLDAITQTFDKFHRFLDLLRQIGLEDLVKLSGIDTKTKHIKLECRKKTHSPDRKQKIKSGLQVQQEPNKTSNFITTPTENRTLGSLHTAMIPKIRTSENSTNTHQLQEDTDHKNCDLSFKPVVLNSVSSMIRTLQNTTSSQQNNTRRAVQLLPEDVEQRNSNLDFKPDVLNKVHNPSLSVEKASFYKAGDDLFQYVMNKVSDALISLNHASNKEAVDISTYLVNPSVARDSQTTNSQSNLSDGEGLSHLKNVENKVKKSKVDQRKSSYPQLQMEFRDSYGTLEDKVDNCKNELQQGPKSKENSVCHHQLESNSGVVMQPLDHRDSSHGVVMQSLDHRGSSHGVVMQPVDYRGSTHGVVMQPLDHGGSSHGVATQPLGHGGSSHGVATQPLGHGGSSHGVVTQPLDHGDSSSCSRTTQDLRSKSKKTAVMFASDLLAMSTGLEAHVVEKEMDSDSSLVPEAALEEQHSTSVESRYEEEKSHSLSSKQGKATSVYSDTFDTSNDEEICENLHKGVDSSGNTNNSVKEELEETLKSVSESLEIESMDTEGTLKKDETSNGKIEEKEMQCKLSLNASREVPELNENNKPLFKSLDKHVDDLPSFSSLNSLTGLTDMETPSISLSSSVSNKLTGSDIEDF